MSGRLALYCVFLLTPSLFADTLADALARAYIPTDRFSVAELTTRITSYAVSEGDPFLIGYYTDAGSLELKGPLHLIRFSRKRNEVDRVDLTDITTLFQHEIKMGCLGSVLRVRETYGIVYVETHVNPSASCLLILTPKLELRASISGWLLGNIGRRYAIVEASEVHFTATQLLHLEVFDLDALKSIPLYPFKNDPARLQFSRAIARYLSQSWCMHANAPCDPNEFDVSLSKPIAVNQEAQVFGFEAGFDAAGFGEQALKHVPPQTMVYVYRLRGDTWEHREFSKDQFKTLFHGSSLQVSIETYPGAAFRDSTARTRGGKGGSRP